MFKGDVQFIKEDSHDQSYAVVISGILHLAAFGWVWLGANDAGSGTNKNHSDLLGAGTVVNFSADNEFRQRIQLTTASTENSSITAAEVESVKQTDTDSKPLEYSNNSTAVDWVAEKSGEIAGEAMPDTPEFFSADSNVLAEGDGGKARDGSQEDNLRAAYLSALRAAIQAKWPHNDAVRSCSLLLKQAPGGIVVSATTTNCKLSTEEKRTLEAAALMAQPLPYNSFESVYSDSMTLDFPMY